MIDEIEKKIIKKIEEQLNHALLINGFRRLEALEIKREFEQGMRIIENNKKQDQSALCIPNLCKPSIFISILC